jgi:hypothetical protein
VRQSPFTHACVFIQIEHALEEGLHAVTDNLADVAHEAEDIVKRGSDALKGALSRPPAANPTPALAMAGAPVQIVPLPTLSVPETPAFVPVMCAPCLSVPPTSVTISGE